MHIEQNYTCTQNMPEATLYVLKQSCERISELSFKLAATGDCRMVATVQNCGVNAH